MSKKHGVIPETMPINKLLKNTRVTDTSTNMSDCYRIKTDVPKSAKCLDKNSVAKSEDITAVLMQAHMLIGEEAKSKLNFDMISVEPFSISILYLFLSRYISMFLS